MTDLARKHAAAVKRKLLVEFDEADLLAIDELDSNRSRFIREAVSQRIAAIKTEKMNAELADAYKANAEVSLRICEEFTHAER
jgi:hypothetical protein